MPAAHRHSSAPGGLPDIWRGHAERNLPRYTSYPTAVAFQGADDDAQARRWLAGITPDQALSVYVHVPFCKRLCWYCGCHTTVAHDYDRVAAFDRVLHDEIELWRAATPRHGGLAHLHFGGGSPNALRPEAFVDLVRRLDRAFGLRPGAEIAAELDPGELSDAFIDAAARAGVTRASLGVQTFDADVQRRVNRIQPFERVAAVVERLRGSGVAGLNFDLMYGLPGQTEANVQASVQAALSLSPDRVAVFGYAHVPWMKKHQVMIQDVELPGLDARWDQAEAAHGALLDAGYVAIGLDHYARPDDPLAVAMTEGRLRRNFQGYTDDPAPVLIPIGPSSIGQTPAGFIQNAPATNVWGRAVAEGRLPIARALAVTAEAGLRAAVIERLMCDMTVDVAAVCAEHGVALDSLSDALAQARRLQLDGLCRVDGACVTIPEGARRLMRVVAACFDGHLPQGPRRHARAV